MYINLIAAISSNGVMGCNGKLPWRMPVEMDYFKRVTTGHSVVMGRHTAESIGRPLPNRHNIVVSSGFNAPGFITEKSLFNALWTASSLELANPDPNVFVIGGRQIYQECIDKDIVDVMHISTINRQYEGDVLFPEFDLPRKGWTFVKSVQYTDIDKNNPELGYTSITTAIYIANAVAEGYIHRPNRINIPIG